MLTVRALPFRRFDAACDGLLGFYHGELARHWTGGDRLFAHLLSLARLGGWSSWERRMLDPRIRADGLSMADRKGLHRLLNPAAFPLAANPLKNKRLFARIAARAGLPVPDSFDPHEASLARWLDNRPDIIAKPSFRSKGAGIVRYVRAADGWRAGTAPVDEASLLSKLTAIAHEGIVQVHEATHPSLAEVSPGALPTLRVMTCLDESGEPECCGRALRLSAREDHPVDNFNAGNLVCAVDIEGRCGQAHHATGCCDRHPITGGRIPGRAVPDLAAAIGVALAAHRIFRGGFTVIGWDIGLTVRGPVLIEGNWNPGTDVVQLVEETGIGASRLGRLYRHHLGRLTPERWRSARPVEREPRHE